MVLLPAVEVKASLRVPELRSMVGIRVYERRGRIWVGPTMWRHYQMGPVMIEQGKTLKRRGPAAFALVEQILYKHQTT